MSDDQELNANAGDRLVGQAIHVPLVLPKTAEEAFGVLRHHLPLVDWENLVVIRLKTRDGQELLALPASIMEQLLSSVVGLCAFLSHDGPAH